MKNRLTKALSTIVVTLAALLLAGVAFSSSVTKAPQRPQRYGSVIGLRAEKLDEYKKLHAAIWPTVAKKVREANIRNYSIYLRKLPDGNYYLFGYFEYVGDNFQADMAKMAADPEIKRWWKVTDPCQQPLADRTPGQWWASMEEVFHQD